METLLFLLAHIGIAMLVYWVYQNEAKPQKRFDILDKIFDS